MDYFQVRLDRHDDGYQGRPVFGKSNLIYMLVKHESDLLRPLLALMCSPRFRTQVAVLGGYDTLRMSGVVTEIGR